MSRNRYIPLVGLLIVLGTVACWRSDYPVGISDDTFTVEGSCVDRFSTGIPVAVRDSLCKGP